ncbi:MAG: hypothetical protein GX230_10350 [Lentisphaerae bacterium]|jgi:hypothetical protein|nr:hypothetical protein [Lentisphaerota bacterium]
MSTFILTAIAICLAFKLHSEPAAPPATPDAPYMTPHALALILGKEIQNRTADLEGLLFSPAVTSPEIEALRKKSISYDFLLSREMSDADRKQLEQERTETNHKLREVVLAHPVAQKQAAAIESDKMELKKVFQEIREAEMKRRNATTKKETDN